MIRNILKLLFIYTLLSGANALANDLFFDSKGLNIHYKDVGAGKPIVLLHGYTMNSNMWDNSLLLKVLSKSHRVIMIDLRGHGLSDKPSDPKEYGPEVGKDVIRLLDHLNIPKAHLVGVC
jgi:pimeloyl-ACP methyl ester carboxylesterase